MARRKFIDDADDDSEYQGYPEDAYDAWGMDRPDEGEDDPLKDGAMINDFSSASLLN